MKLYQIVLIFLIAPIAAFAQDLGFSSSGGDIEISATDGVVWDRMNGQVMINENATMIQGDMKLVADQIKLSYVEQNGEYTVSLLDANKNVQIFTAGEVMNGNSALFEPSKGIAILKGDNASLVASEGKITARTLEYFKNENKAIARENVTLSSDDGVVKSDIAVAYFLSSKQKNQSGITKIELFDNIEINTKTEKITGNKGVYNIMKEHIVIEGDVVIQKGKNFLNGDIGEINLKTGVSKLRSLSDKQIGGKINSAK